MKLVFVSGPFRGANQWEQMCNVREAETLALEVWRMGAACICPHTNTAHFQGAAPDDVWLTGDLEILRRCDAVMVTPRWRQSVGARAELAEADYMEMPIFYNMADLRAWLNVGLAA